jgi:type IV secretory pathway TrbD component
MNVTGFKPPAPGQALPPPRAVAIAGLVFSLLMIISLGIMRLALPNVLTEQSTVIQRFGHSITLALHLVPFAAIAFLWFLGVLHSRIAAAEDPFFTTVFMGSGLLFLTSLFAAAAVSGAVLGATPGRPIEQVSSEVFHFAEQVCYAFLNVFATRMAGVFIISTCTIALRTGIFPRWIAFCGYACAVVLLLVISNWLWIEMLFPVWTILVSVYLLLAKERKPSPA